MSKHVIFVLDTSGSMRGKKMLQTQSAMKTILSELREQDYMSIINFSDEMFVWEHENSRLIPASEENVERSIDHVNGLEPSGM